MSEFAELERLLAQLNETSRATATLLALAHCHIADLERERDMLRSEVAQLREERRGLGALGFTPRGVSA